jgi:precorrin-6A/cobalt-precorrin-6A reductase
MELISTGRIWLIGGTSESSAIAKALIEEKFPCRVTVTTNSARNLYPQNPWLQVRVGCLDLCQAEKFVHQQGIRAIVDASHPYATEISYLAIALSQKYEIPYLRFERPLHKTRDREKVIELERVEQLLHSEYLDGKRVLLTIGCKALPLFQNYHHRSKLFARILPRVESLEVALKSGFPPQQIIALRSPISQELEMALWQQWQIDLVVTKASGKAGGEETKLAVAQKLDIPLIVISRPKLTYPQQTSDLSQVLAFCQEYVF